jgi:hypothetical protein
MDKEEKLRLIKKLEEKDKHSASQNIKVKNISNIRCNG